MRVLQVLAGAEQGGAEGYFDRLVLAFNEAKNFEQQVITRPHPTRVERLSETNLQTAPFNNPVDLKTPGVLRAIDKVFQPQFSIYWMNRAASFSKHVKNGINIGRLGGYYDLKYYKHCQELICATPDLVRYCVENGWPEDRVCYMPNFSDPPTSNTNLPIINGTRLEKQGPTVFALGRFHENKAFDTLLKAMAQLPDLMLWLAGDGPLKAELQEQATDNVVFVPWQYDITPLMHHADIFCCPSRHEPFGNVMIEGFSHKKLVVATKSQGAQHIIEQNRTGLLCEIDDVNGLAQTIQQAFSDEVNRQEIVANAYEHWQQNYSKAAVVGKYRHYFKELSQ